MNAMTAMAAAEMDRVKRAWDFGGGTPRPRASRATRAKVEKAINAAAGIHHVTPEQILGRKRYPAIVEARQAAMLLAREAGLSYPDIGLNMDRDHTTIMHGVRRAKERLCPAPIFKSVRKTK